MLIAGQGFCAYLCKGGVKGLQGLFHMQIFKEAWCCPFPVFTILSISQIENRQSGASLKTHQHSLEI